MVAILDYLASFTFDDLTSLARFGAFALISLVIIVFSLLVVISRDAVRASIALIVSLFSVAGLYILLNAQFLGVVQILVYVGAVGVLIMFAVMLTKAETGRGPYVR
ncbi:MAG: NADH-quinone oxidoreductase subunit J [Methanohalobium sp.]|uniref:NADH-quinone oxidoreductase subunit J n=1 Tax=Methanohalobium sp. TaxID=2837493 RepID=UPI003978E893